MQYFENLGTRRSKESVTALKLLGAPCHAKVLSRATARFKSRRRSRIRSVEEYVENALLGEFDRFDREFAGVSTDPGQSAGGLLANNRSDFVLVGGISDPGVLERDAEMERIGRKVMREMETRSGRNRHR